MDWDVKGLPRKTYLHAWDGEGKGMWGFSREAEAGGGGGRLSTEVLTLQKCPSPMEDKLQSIDAHPITARTNNKRGVAIPL